jgi:hypothetical protein
MAAFAVTSPKPANFRLIEVDRRFILRIVCFCLFCGFWLHVFSFWRHPSSFSWFLRFFRALFSTALFGSIMLCIPYLARFRSTSDYPTRCSADIISSKNLVLLERWLMLLSSLKHRLILFIA